MIINVENNEDVLFIGNFPKDIDLKNMSFFWESFFHCVEINDEFKVNIIKNKTELQATIIYKLLKQDTKKPSWNDGGYSYTLYEDALHIPVRETIMLLNNDWNIENIIKGGGCYE